MIIGGEDSEIIKDEKVAKVKMQLEDHYLINIDSFSFGENEVGNDFQAVLDTGNTLICIPLSYQYTFSAALKALNLNCYIYEEANPDFYQLGCEVPRSLENIPDITVKIQDIPFTIKGKDLVGTCLEDDAVEEGDLID